MKNPKLAGPGLPVLSLIVLAAAGLAESSPAVERTYRYYRFTPDKLRNDGAIADRVQLSEFRFFRQGATLSLSGVVVTNPNGNNPAGQTPAMLIDGDLATKWVDTHIGPVVFDFGSPTAIDAYNFFTANDANERDPVSWTFEGSDDSASWSTLDIVRDAPLNTVRQLSAALYANGTSSFPLHPVAIGKFASDLSVIENGNPVALEWDTRLADGGVSITPFPGGVNESGSSILFPFDNAENVYTLTGENSVDGSRSATVTVRTVTPASISYRYLRFTAVKLRRHYLSEGIQMSEFRFFSGGTPITPVGVVNPGGNYIGSEVPQNLIDNNVNTKWYDRNKSYLVFDFGENDASTPLTHYSFTTANDCSQRDPVRWIIEGSDDQSSWTAVDSLASFDVNVPANRKTSTQVFPFPAAPPPSVRFSPDTDLVFAGYPVVLSWDSTEAIAIDIGDGTDLVGSSLPLSGSLSLTPSENTTYTLTAVSANGSSTSQQVSVTVIDPPLKSVAYENFDQAESQFRLFRSSSIVNDFANLTYSGNHKRLRINPNQSNQRGIAWYLRRVSLAQGFQSSFDLQFSNLSGGAGADGMGFVIQNHPLGSHYSERYDGIYERGIPSDALTISFDSYQNSGSPEPSSAILSVIQGAANLHTVDLAAIPGLAFRGRSGDLTTNSGATAPYRVRINYVPGDMDIYIDNILVLQNAAIDLQAAGAVDSRGTAFVGFMARTGGQTESHDVTRWFLHEGPAAGPPALGLYGKPSIIASSRQLNLSWNSSPLRTYRITASSNLAAWTPIATGLLGDAGSSTSHRLTYPSVTPAYRFFRVEEEE